jgi:ketosteroid isomerase-like protein
LNVAVTAAGEAVDLAGKEVGLKVQSEWDFFVWLEKRKDGRWKVTHSTYRPKGVAVNGQEYIPNQ